MGWNSLRRLDQRYGRIPINKRVRIKFRLHINKLHDRSRCHSQNRNMSCEIYKNVIMHLAVPKLRELRSRTDVFVVRVCACAHDAQKCIKCVCMRVLRCAYACSRAGTRGFLCDHTNETLCICTKRARQTAAASTQTATTLQLRIACNVGMPFFSRCSVVHSFRLSFMDIPYIFICIQFSYRMCVFVCFGVCMMAWRTSNMCQRTTPCSFCSFPFIRSNKILQLAKRCCFFVLFRRWNAIEPIAERVHQQSSHNRAERNTLTTTMMMVMMQWNPLESLHVIRTTIYRLPKNARILYSTAMPIPGEFAASAGLIDSGRPNRFHHYARCPIRCNQIFSHSRIVHSSNRSNRCHSSLISHFSHTFVYFVNKIYTINSARLQPNKCIRKKNARRTYSSRANTVSVLCVCELWLCQRLITNDDVWRDVHELQLCLCMLWRCSLSIDENLNAMQMLATATDKKKLYSMKTEAEMEWKDAKKQRNAGTAIATQIGRPKNQFFCLLSEKTEIVLYAAAPFRCALAAHFKIGPWNIYLLCIQNNIILLLSSQFHSRYWLFNLLYGTKKQWINCSGTQFKVLSQLGIVNIESHWSQFDRRWRTTLHHAPIHHECVCVCFFFPCPILGGRYQHRMSRSNRRIRIDWGAVRHTAEQKNAFLNQLAGINALNVGIIASWTYLFTVRCMAGFSANYYVTSHGQLAHRMCARSNNRIVSNSVIVFGRTAHTFIHTYKDTRQVRIQTRYAASNHQSGKHDNFLLTLLCPIRHLFCHTLALAIYLVHCG